MAQVDTSIYSNLLRPPKSVEEYDQDAQQATANKLTLLLKQGEYDSQQQSMKRQNALTGLLQSGADANALRQHGYLKEASDWEQSAAKANQDNAQADSFRATAKKTGIEAQAKKAALYRDQLPMISSPQQAAQWLAASYNDPDIGSFLQSAGRLEDVISKIPQDPQGFADWKLQAAEGVGKFADMLMERRKQAEVERSNRVDEGIARGNLSVAQGNLGLRSKELTFQQTKDGLDRKEKAAGGGKTGAPTEGERKAATLLQRMRGSMAQLEAAVGEDSGAAKPGLMAEAIRSVPLIGGDTPANLVTSQARQRAEAAQLDILDAALTLGTGAAYTKEQLRGYAKSYFPQIGDDAKTVKDKQARLANVIRAAEVAADRADPQPRGAGGASGSWGNGWKIEEVK